jgi:hypothetical protein
VKYAERPPSYQLVVQTCHFAVACALAQLAVTVGAPGRWGLLIVMIFALCKEFILDTLVPTSWGGEEDAWWGSFMDFLSYLAGFLVCGLVFWLTGTL